METISKRKEKGLPVLNKNLECNFEGYDVSLLMSETAKLRNLITKRGTLEILIPLCCSADPVRHKQFRHALKGFSTRTLSIRLKELENGGILERHRYNEIPPRVEYTLTTKGQELVESVVGMLQWMRKWAKVKRSNNPIIVT
jgi:DNA-binding HxlR family transcriptional regulator